MKSGANIRGVGDEQFVDAHLIMHHRIANVLNQTGKFIRILGIVKKSLDLPLTFQQVEFSKNGFQVPNSPCLSDSTPDLGECALTLLAPSSSLFPRHRLEK